MSRNYACVSDDAQTCIERRYNTDLEDTEDCEYCECHCHDDPYDEWE